MSIVFTKADMTALNAVMELIHRAVAHMESLGISQWDDIYPSVDVIADDISSGTLYTGSIDGRLAVIFVLSRSCDEAYRTCSWTENTDNYMVLHRLCVEPELQGCGIGRQALDYILAMLTASGVKTLRLDVFTLNPYALRLYEHAGFSPSGYADWRKGRFLLMEKSL